jgi:hypothetical protein
MPRQLVPRGRLSCQNILLSAACFHRPIAQSVNKGQDLSHGFVDFRRDFLFKIEAGKNL